MLEAPEGKPQVICRAAMTGSFEMHEGETTPVSPSEILDPFYEVPRGRRAPAGILADLRRYLAVASIGTTETITRSLALVRN